jgi:hypothetical protein
VRIEGKDKLNRSGIGTRIHVYPGGAIPDTVLTSPYGARNDLIGCREIASGYGYASCQPAEAHFGLGRNVSAVDIEVYFPHNGGSVIRRGVPVDGEIVIRPGE